MGVYQQIIRRIPVEKGWSADRKYCAVTADGTKYLLRISSVYRPGICSDRAAAGDVGRTGMSCPYHIIGKQKRRRMIPAALLIMERFIFSLCGST